MFTDATSELRGEAAAPRPKPQAAVGTPLNAAFVDVSNFDWVSQDLRERLKRKVLDKLQKKGLLGTHDAS